MVAEKINKGALTTHLKIQQRYITPHFSICTPLESCICVFTVFKHIHQKFHKIVLGRTTLHLALIIK